MTIALIMARKRYARSGARVPAARAAGFPGLTLTFDPRRLSGFRRDRQGDGAVEGGGDLGFVDVDAAGGGVDALGLHLAAEAGGGGEVDILVEDVALFDGGVVAGDEGSADFGDEVFGGGGAGGEEDRGGMMSDE